MLKLKEVVMYKKVVVPLDGSELAECSLDEVMNVIGEGSELLLIRAMEPVSGMAYAEVPPEILEQAEKKNVDASKRYLDKVAGRLKKKGIRVQTEVVWGNPADEIIAFAKKNNADLIMITTHGRSGVSRWALGSVADKVLRMARIPVLMVIPAACRVG